MILTYYQSVELMTFLPVLLSPSDTNTNLEAISKAVTTEAKHEEDSPGVYQMWNISTTGMEVNGAAFF